MIVKSHLIFMVLCNNLNELRLYFTKKNRINVRLTFRVRVPHSLVAGCILSKCLSEPKLAIQISEPFFVVVPAAVEINRAIQPLLEHCPSPTGCCLVTVHVKDTSTVWVDLVNSTCSFSSFVQSSTVLPWKT